MWEAITSSITGALIWELIRSSLTQIIKHLKAKSEGRRTLLRGELKDVGKRLDLIFQLAMDYYGSPSYKGGEKVRSLEIELKSLDVSLDSLNDRLIKLNMKTLGLSHMISFRQNLVVEAKTPRHEALNSDDPIILGIIHATQRLRDSIYERTDDLT